MRGWDEQPFGDLLFSDCECVGYGLCAAQGTHRRIAENDHSTRICNLDILRTINHTTVPVSMGERQHVGPWLSEGCDVQGE